MRTEIVGGPLDGKQMDLPNGARYLDIPVVQGLPDRLSDHQCALHQDPRFDVVRLGIDQDGYARWPKGL